MSRRPALLATSAALGALLLGTATATPAFGASATPEPAPVPAQETERGLVGGLLEGVGGAVDGVTDVVPGVLDGVGAVLGEVVDLRIDEQGLDAGVGVDGLSLAQSLDSANNIALPFVVGQLLPEISPPGANDFGCVPGPERPDPVILVHGTFANAYNNWVQLSGDLAADGACVFAVNYGDIPGIGVKGLGDIPTSAGQLAEFVDAVLAATGAEQVDLVGHSQGGMMPRYYLQELGGAQHVDQLIALSPSNYGTSLNGVLPLLGGLPGGDALVGLPCDACVQQRAGSDFLTALNADGDTVDGVEYTVISTVYDEVVTPYTDTFLRGEGVTNITLQDVCGLDLSDHIGIAYDPIALQLVENALYPESAVQPACGVVLPLVS